MSPSDIGLFENPRISSSEARLVFISLNATELLFRSVFGWNSGMREGYWNHVRSRLTAHFVESVLSFFHLHVHAA